MQTEAWLITKWDAELIRQRRWAARLIEAINYFNVLPAMDDYKIFEVQSYPDFKGAEGQGNTKIAEPKIKHFIEQARRNKI